jgi:hypothetical protein
VVLRRIGFVWLSPVVRSFRLRRQRTRARRPGFVDLRLR